MVGLTISIPSGRYNSNDSGNYYGYSDKNDWMPIKTSSPTDELYSPILEKLVFKSVKSAKFGRAKNSVEEFEKVEAK